MNRARMLRKLHLIYNSKIFCSGELYFHLLMKHSLFWSTSAPSFLQEGSTLFEKLNEGILIDVQRTHISKVNSNSVTLDNGTHLTTDAIIFATGWNLTFSKFFTPETRLELDLPIPFGTEPPVLKEYWKELDLDADQWVHKTFPFLSNPPKTYETSPDHTPYHLYRQSVPTSLATRNDRSIIFLGVLASPQIPTYAELSSLWSIAYLEHMHAPEIDKVFSDKLTMDLDTARANAFMKWRYRRAGIIEPNVGAEVQDLCDLLCEELGVEARRKSRIGGWKGSWNEWFEPYRSMDYKGVVGEFLEVVRKREEGKTKSE